MFPLAEIGEGNMLTVLLDFKNNLINWFLLVGLIWWLCAKYLPAVFVSRKESILAALAAAKSAEDEAKTFLEEQKARIKIAEQETEKILDEAKQTAEQMRIQMEDETKRDIANLFQKFESTIANERQAMVVEMRIAAVKAAVQSVEKYLASHVSDTVKAHLLNQFMEQLDVVSREEKSLTPGASLESIH